LAYRILIADDQKLVRKMLKTLLETHADWQVCAEAANGLEATQKAAELQPDMIILDLAMPEMDGLHAAREILSNNPAVPILLHTNHAFSSLALEAKKNGIREVINKSASEQELISAVESLLNQGATVGANSDGLENSMDIDRMDIEKLADVGNIPLASNLKEADKLPDEEQQSSEKSEAT
jgi:two-component system, NarL family, response regulator DesR